MHWYRITKRAAWRNLTETRRDLPHADAVGVDTVFDIGGKFRLIAAIKYRWRAAYIRNILTHTEYGRDQWK